MGNDISKYVISLNRKVATQVSSTQGLPRKGDAITVLTSNERGLDNGEYRVTEVNRPLTSESSSDGFIESQAVVFVRPKRWYDSFL